MTDLDPWTVSYSELDTFKQCPWKWARLYRERWVAPTTSRPLVWGTAWHRIMEAHYTAVMQGQALAEFKVDTEELNYQVRAIAAEYDEETRDLMVWSYQGYLDAYGFDPQWHILAVEWKYELPLNMNYLGREIRLKLKADLVIKDQMKRTWIVDHKFTGNLWGPKELDLDDQFGLYTWAVREAGMEVFGSIHNGTRSFKSKKGNYQPLDERFRRSLLNRTDIELDNLAIDARATIQMMGSLATGAEPRFSDPDRCKWRCPLTEPCLASRKGRQVAEVLGEFGFTVDPTRH